MKKYFEKAVAWGKELGWIHVAILSAIAALVIYMVVKA